MLGLRFYFNERQPESWVTDGTLDWLWPQAERAGVPTFVRTVGQFSSREHWDRSLTDTGAPLPNRQGRRPQIGVVVAASTLLGLDEEPGELAGVGPVTAPLARRIAADGEWRRLLTDPRTGRLDEVSADTYAPPQDMVDHVITRDATCRGIGCRMPANRCDLDHEVPWPAGPTAITNLHPLHQRHHDAKTHTDTTVTTEPDGTTVWSLPSGRVYRVPPHQLLQHPDLDPEPEPTAPRPFAARSARSARSSTPGSGASGPTGIRYAPRPPDTFAIRDSRNSASFERLGDASTTTFLPFNTFAALANARSQSVARWPDAPGTVGASSRSPRFIHR